MAEKSSCLHHWTDGETAEERECTRCGVNLMEHILASARAIGIEVPPKPFIDRRKAPEA